MRERLEALSEREKQTLRLLLHGHDAKSIAGELGLSVHTVNERLRDARRKLGVSSSREAARLLDAMERADPQFLGDTQLGVAAGASPPEDRGRSDGRTRKVPRGLAAGALSMTFILAALALAVSFGTGSAFHSLFDQAPGAALMSEAAPRPAPLAAAQEWIALVDRGDWGASWREAGTLFTSQLSAEQWAASVVPVREPLGAARSRSVHSATQATTLPGAPAGDYELLEFRTDFANKPQAIETVVLTAQGGEWRVVGYFIR